MSTTPERNIQIELYRIFQNLISKKFSFNGIEFTDVKFEPIVNGRPDLTVEAIDKGKKLSLLVIETKRKVPFIDRKFDPYSKDVIKQASGYAVDLGAPYFATCNGDVFVLFDTFTAGVPLPQRKLKHYPVSYDEDFAKTILEEVCRFRAGLGKWLELDDVFLLRLRAFHTFITPFVLKSLTQQLSEDMKFKAKYVNWLKSQLFEYSPEMNETIAEQLAYMLMNQITFYKTLETQTSQLPKLHKIETEDPKFFANELRERFDQVRRDIDYEAIFEPHAILEELKLPKTLIYTLNDFIEELGTYHLANIRNDVIGRVYEELIPDVERHKLGQYYTPPPIIELITEMCIESPDDIVLDPSCGSGGFLVKAYHKLRDLKKKQNPFAEDDKLHEEILNQLFGIDINPFPAQLSSINLAVRNLKVTSKNINVIISDFFKIRPQSHGIPKELEVVITNPPYTRQEEMDYKSLIRNEALTYSDGSQIQIGGQAGIYAYFFTHSAKFLKRNGRMGYITSNTWLDVKFGEGLKQFFLDHFKILGIVEFDGAVFGSALVNTCISILEKEEKAEERNQNLVRFIRIKKQTPIDKIVDLISKSEKDLEDDQLRVVIKNQSQLQAVDRWGKYIRAPQIYFKVVTHPNVTRLNKVAAVKRGFVTGFNDFFILDKGKINQWQIEPDYLKPIVTSSRNIKGWEINRKDILEWVLTVHDSKDQLKNKKVLNYLEHGEEIDVSTKRGTRIVSDNMRGVQNLQTCKSRQNWYDIGQHQPPPIIAPYLMWERAVFAQNKAQALAPNTLHFVYPFDDNDIIFLLGVTNSTLIAFFLEVEGRSYGGGVLKMEAYEMAELPIIDPKKVTKTDRAKIESAFLELSAAQETGNVLSVEKAKNKLDDAVFDALKIKQSERLQIKEGLKSLREMRLKRKDLNVLVQTAEKWKPHVKPKKEKIVKVDPSKRLDSWIA